MRKIVLFFLVLLMAVPAMAVESNVAITCDDDANCVTVSYLSDANLIRAFGLDITVDNGATITKVEMVDANYRIYPGQIVIDDGTITDYNTPYAPGSIPGSSVTVEMGSLYTNDPCYESDPCAGFGMQPGLSGVLLKFYANVPGIDCNYYVTENGARGGVVMESPDEVPTVTLCSGKISPCPPVPDVATNPTPAASATCIAPNPILSWTPGANTATQDVYFGTTTPPPLVASGIPVGTTTYATVTTVYTKYYWQIVEKNSCGDPNAGPIWCFLTGPNLGKPCCQNETPACLGNVNGDTRVNTSDVGALTSFISGLGSPFRCTTAVGSTTCKPCNDLNGDGRVNTSDVGALTALISGWGSPFRQTCPWLKCP
ncbi:MAG: hypothetical protein PHY02_07615 [Phycisphaerae bacterium]|nr:hypothetical protein [Phycisphaerae bacterium]